MSKERNVQVNEAIAKLFYDQCMGSYCGHMANIPNNPVMQSILTASGVKDERDFKLFLQAVYNNLPESNF